MACQSMSKTCKFWFWKRHINSYRVFLVQLHVMGNICTPCVNENRFMLFTNIVFIQNNDRSKGHPYFISCNHRKNIDKNDQYHTGDIFSTLGIEATYMIHRLARNRCCSMPFVIDNKVPLFYVLSSLMKDLRLLLKIDNKVAVLIVDGTFHLMKEDEEK